VILSRFGYSFKVKSVPGRVRLLIGMNEAGPIEVECGGVLATGTR